MLVQWKSMWYWSVRLSVKLSWTSILSSDFLTHIDPVFGSCFTFNHNRTVNLTSIRAGTSNVKLELFSNLLFRTYVWITYAGLRQCFWLYAHDWSHRCPAYYPWQGRLSIPGYIWLLCSNWICLLVWSEIEKDVPLAGALWRLCAWWKDFRLYLS